MSLFYATQMINSFLNARISANHDKADRLSANGDIHIKGNLFLYCRISFVWCAGKNNNQIVNQIKVKGFPRNSLINI